MGILKAGLLALACALAGQTHAAVDVEQYIRNEGYGRMAISPDGLYYAATVQLEDRGGLVIVRRADKKVVAGAAGWKGSLVDSFWWAKNDRVVLSTAERLGSRDRPYHTGTLYALGVDGSRLKTLVGPKTEPGLVDRIGDLGPWEMATLIDPLPDDPTNVLIAAWEEGTTPTTRIERLDVRTGRRTTIATAPVRRADFTIDTRGRVRFADGLRDDNFSRLYYRDDDAGEWRLINDASASGHYEHPIGFADDVTAYLRVSQDSGPDAVVAWNTRTGERRTVQRDDTVDPYEPVYDRDGRTVIGIRYMGDTPQTRLFDPATPAARMHRALAKAFPGSSVSVTSFTRDGHEALVQVSDDRTPGDTYLFDTTTMVADGLTVQREWFDPATLAPARAVAVPARDGLMLHGFLTPPRGATGDGPWPTVVMPHGGPFAVFDMREFDDDTHLLSEAGYAVLRINFRGSGNYGNAFSLAGAREWGGRMQDDLTDATHWLVDKGFADASRICIYGASYGGYAALMGVAREPTLYRCAVGYVGVYDLEAMHRDTSREAQWLKTWAGDWLGDRDTLAARSPITLAARIKVPVLLVAGGEDRTAPIEHSRKMERAIRAAGGSVETLYVASEGHGFYTDAHRREFYTKLLDFLSRSIGGATAARAGSP